MFYVYFSQPLSSDYYMDVHVVCVLARHEIFWNQCSCWVAEVLRRHVEGQPPPGAGQLVQLDRHEHVVVDFDPADDEQVQSHAETRVLVEARHGAPEHVVQSGPGAVVHVEGVHLGVGGAGQVDLGIGR